MLSSSTHSSIRRVLSISDTTSTHEFLKRALHVSDHEALMGDGAQKLVNPIGDSLSALSFTLVSVEDWQSVFQNVADAKRNGASFSLVFLVVCLDEWDRLRQNIEKIWELDDTIRCILCPASETHSCSTNLSLSRPGQWAMFRMPGFPEELFQLASCLSVCSVSLSPCKSDEPRIVDANITCDGEAMLGVSNEVAVRQAELASARDELATSKVYVENVLRSMADSLLVIDANLTIGSVNPSLLELLGYEEDALIGQSPGLIFGEEFAQGSIIENLLLQGSVSSVESSFLTCDGQVIPISVSGSMIQDEQGQFQGLVCVAQDITERKRMEEEQLQLHEQLLETSRQLGMASVASDVLHNVGNVLNSINVSIGVIADLMKNSMVGDVGRVSQLFHKHREDLGNYFSTNPKGKQIPPYLEKLSGQLIEERRVAIAEINRLREHAHQALQCVAAQQDLGTPSGITEPISVVELLEEALAVNHELLETGHVYVTREFQEVPQLIVDKRQVLEVMIDVMKNACQAMASVLDKQLIVRAKLIPGPPDSVCLEVQDSGVGIDAEDIINIFRQGNSPQDGGRGMSLHNGALMAKNLGGALQVHSQGIGHGATFSLELPGNFHFPDL